MSERLRLLSLCSGYGGLDAAVSEHFGAELAAYAENDPGKIPIMEHHFPGVPNLGDITKTVWETAGRYDVIAAGFPCQDISNAGKRVGITGERSGIWVNVFEAIRVIRPRYVVLENVSAIRTRGLNVVVGDLSQIGYDARWSSVRASAIGAPHHRDRWFCVATPTDPYSVGR